MNLDSLQVILKEKCGLSKDSPVLVGVSGGPDSLCLLSVLKECSFLLQAVHINHHLRAEADSEAARVKQYCLDWSIPFLQFDVDVNTFSSEQKLSIEESARILRYQYLMKAAVEVSAQALAVAHQADDQVETILMHLLRGSGMGGLKGMSYRSYNSAFSNDIPIVRPLLGVWRSEIERYCSERKITPCYDQSNSDQTYFRNRIRHDLVPILKTYNSQADQHLWQLSQLFGDEDRFLQELTQVELERVSSRRGNGFLVVKRSLFNQLDTALQRRAVRQIFASLRENLRDIGFDPVEKARQFLQNPSAKGDCQLLQRVSITRLTTDKDLIHTQKADLAEIWPLIASGTVYQIQREGEWMLNDHWKIITSVQTAFPFEMNKDSDTAYFDLDHLPEPLSLSVWKNGDVFSPFGMAGKQIKVGDYFTNIHLPELARVNWPILRMDQHILWLAGLRRANIAPVNSETRQVLAVQLLRTD
jgi:tRNA(Ile)-lysidine synthase